MNVCKSTIDGSALKELVFPRVVDINVESLRLQPVFALG